MLHTLSSLNKFSPRAQDLIEMSIYQIGPYDSHLTPSMRCGTVLDNAELLALLNLVIPTSDAVLPRMEMTSLSPMPQAPAHSFTPQDALECAFEVESPRFLSDLVNLTTPDSPSWDQLPDWIEPLPYHCPDSTLNFEAPLRESLAFLLVEDPLVMPETSQNKASECQIAGCHTKKQSNGRCIRHGGGRRCIVRGCTRGAQSLGRCKRHGGGARCTIQGCTTSSQGGGLCRTHGGGKLCTAPGCKKGAQRQGKCATHASRKCSIVGCSKNARSKGICSRHRKEAEALA